MRKADPTNQDHTLDVINRATARRRVLTVTYLKVANVLTPADRVVWVMEDGKGVRLTETVRTIEVIDVERSSAGKVILIVLDHETREKRHMRLDRLRYYTVGRTNSFKLAGPNVNAEMITNFWTVTNRAGEEVTRVLANTIEDSREVALQLTDVRRLSNREGGFSLRRLRLQSLVA